MASVLDGIPMICSACRKPVSDHKDGIICNFTPKNTLDNVIFMIKNNALSESEKNLLREALK